MLTKKKTSVVISSKTSRRVLRAQCQSGEYVDDPSSSTSAHEWKLNDFQTSFAQSFSCTNYIKPKNMKTKKKMEWDLRSDTICFLFWFRDLSRTKIIMYWWWNGKCVLYYCFALPTLIITIFFLLSYTCVARTNLQTKRAETHLKKTKSYKNNVMQKRSFFFFFWFDELFLLRELFVNR